MAYPVFPSELPRPQQQGFRLDFGDGRMLFRPDSGPPMLRQRFAAVVHPIAFSFMLNREHLGRLEYFVNVETEQGASMFIMDEPLLAGFSILDENGDDLLDEDGEPLLYSDTMLVAFAERGLPSISVRGGDTYGVAFQVIRFPTA
jgi:hypothetical protein